jgi:hypothetical protein
VSGAPARPKKESLKHNNKDTDKNMSTKNKKRIVETMTDHKTGTREEWLAARLELLEAE